MGNFITEDWLRSRHSLARHTEITLPRDAKLTPSAEELLKSRDVAIRYLDDKGSVFRAEPDNERHAVHALTGRDRRTESCCQLCRQPVARKTEALTHLNADTLVAKNHPRIAFRGKLDSAIAQAVWAQAEWEERRAPAPLAHYLADIRSALGNVLRAEVCGEAMPPIAMGDADDARLHELSHRPLALLGHDHIVPSVEHGADVARLNLLRTTIRECETAAAGLFLDADFQVSRPDILQALNRLSSAVYVLMLLALLARLGKPLPNLGETS
ncbi:ethanolamine utilization cob(I)yrinic acid a,c-diamide adenosyltransferase EutT [Paludibacterium paludis]|uniref:Ethanolamine utilization cobalamin adenosyltransferase n=1 Tax=Paludibacterium paludis TaxID=1225769 RepID=A0A918NWH9_9NEIS|nr:ethanolamine utilization cob(I)yrinic acid a,c-diamide adenosyltransferase EutT [Paludibacterium paludis]GGY02320.1 ethanolamine utilization cobalamin adenosyltransferase [Paludibacterium paludis]